MPEQPLDSETMQPAEELDSMVEPDNAEVDGTTGLSALCPKCGAEIPEAARFCASCGKVIDSVAIAASAKKKKRLAIAIGAIVLVLVIGASAGGVVVVRQQQAAKVAAEAAAAKKVADEKAAAKHAEQADELREVFNKVAAIDSAVSVGTNERDYTSRVQDARAALDAYDPPDSQSQDVVTKLESAMDLYSSASTYWNAAIVDSYSSPDESLLSAGWQTAGENVEAARVMVDSYRNTVPTGVSTE